MHLGPNIPMPKSMVRAISVVALHICAGQAQATDTTLMCPDLQARACATLATALTDRYGTTVEVITPQMTPPTDGLNVTFKLTLQTETILEGRLIWWHRADDRTQGPVIGVSVVDRTVGPDTFDTLVQALAKASDLPL